MNNKHLAYLATDTPAERELLARLLEWQTNGFVQQFCPSQDQWTKRQYEPAVRSRIPDSACRSPSRIIADTTGPIDRTAPHCSLNTVVAYEDVGAAKKAKEMWDRLRRSIGGGISFEIHLWRFDVLRTPELRDTAVNDAAQARLIMVATRGQQDLPAETKAWIDLWVTQRKGRTGALVLLVAPLEESVDLRTVPQFAFLKEVAQRARLEFFASICNATKQTV